MFTPEQAKTIADLFLLLIERETQTTRRVLQAVPADQLEFKLGDKGRTTRELMWHVVTSDSWFGDSIAAGSFAAEGGQPPAPASKDEMLAVYEKNVPAAIAKCRALTGERLATMVNFLNVFNLPLVLYLNVWMVHTVHHRAQLATYLRAMNAHVPDIYGGSADEPFQMPVTA